MEKEKREIDLINPQAAMNLREQIKSRVDTTKFRYSSMPIGGLAYIVKEYMEMHEEITMDDVENPQGFVMSDEMFNFIKMRMIAEGYYIIDPEELVRAKAYAYISGGNDDWDDESNDIYDDLDDDDLDDEDGTGRSGLETFQDDYGGEGDNRYDEFGEFID